MTDNKELIEMARCAPRFTLGTKTTDDLLLEMADALEAATAELQKLRDILLAIEMFTATGEGLDSEATINVHILAAEGRSDDPCAWRADPAAIERLRSALRGEARRNFIAGIKDEVMATAGAEQRWISDTQNACPFCGGSGHKDDAPKVCAEGYDCPEGPGGACCGISAAEQVAVVKPIEWKEYPTGSFTGLCVLGKYTVEENKDGRFVRRGRLVDKFFESVESARTSCEVDYQRRILSAITLRSAADVEAEARAAERAKVISEVWGVVFPKNDPSDWTDFAEDRARLAVQLKDTLHTPASLAVKEGKA